MAITLNKYSNRFDIFGDRVDTGYLDVSFGSNYVSGGESLASGLAKLKFKDIYSIIAEPRDGYTFASDVTNEKLKVFAPAPVVVHEEYVIVTDNVGYLRYPVAHINYIAGCTVANTPTLSMIPIAGAVTPATGQCAVDQGFNDATGVLTKGQRTSLTFLAGDAIVGCYVSYATQAWRDVVDNMSMAKMISGVEAYGDGLAFNGAGDPDIVTLGADIVAMQSITWSDGGDAGTIKVPELLMDGGAPAATLETEIDFVKAVTFAEVNTLAADAIDTPGDIVRYVYIKHPGVGTYLGDRFTNVSIAVAADTITYTGTPLIYGHCGQMPMATSDKQAIWVAVADAVAARQIHWTTHPWGYPGCAVGAAPIATMEAGTDDNNVPAWINGNPSEIEAVPLEVPNATDLSGLTNIRVIVVGILQN